MAADRTEPGRASGGTVDPASILRKARRLLMRAGPKSATDLSGAYLGARPGTGLTFAELRAYEPGDDVRHLDWNVTARQGRPYVRRYTEERALVLRLIVDASASLRFGPEGRSKADRAAQAAALLAAAAIQNGDRVGLTLVSDRVEAEVRPGAGPGHLALLLRTLIATSASSRRSGLSAGLGGLDRSRRRSLVVAIGDYLQAEPPGPWRRASTRHDVMAIRVEEPREVDLPDAGLLPLRDAETGRLRVVDSGSAAVRRAHREAAEARRRAFRAWCASAGVAGHDLSTADDPLAALRRILRRPPNRARRP